MGNQNDGLEIAVVTGGHAFDVINFHRLFRGLEGITPYIQHIDDFAASPRSVRDSYQAVLFYSMMREGPTDDGLPKYAGKPKSALTHLAESRQGIVIVHHALLAYPDWPLWSQLVGIQDRHLGDPVTYVADQEIDVHIANAEHPIIQDISDWHMVDEVYGMDNPDPQSEVILRTDHAKSIEALAWTRTHLQARVFCLALGHDDQAWSNVNFQRVLTQGMRWAAGDGDTD